MQQKGLPQSGVNPFFFCPHPRRTQGLCFGGGSVGVGLAAVAYADNKGWLDRALGSLATCINLCGIWSILFLGVLPCLLAGIIAAREFKHPILTVTFEPQPQEEE
jgi:hypothetical protein